MLFKKTLAYNDTFHFFIRMHIRIIRRNRWGQEECSKCSATRKAGNTVQICYKIKRLSFLHIYCKGSWGNIDTLTKKKLLLSSGLLFLLLNVTLILDPRPLLFHWTPPKWIGLAQISILSMAIVQVLTIPCLWFATYHIIALLKTTEEYISIVATPKPYRHHTMLQAQKNSHYRNNDSNPKENQATPQDLPFLNWWRVNNVIIGKNTSLISFFLDFTSWI